jgi:ABC-type protease/lipase transport system fused ATPase/permease subunit
LQIINSSFVLPSDQLWMQPEMKQLRAFNKLRKLSVRGIFVEFDILWTMAFLVVAPSIEMLQIEVMQL